MGALYTTKRLSRNVLAVYVDLSALDAEQWFLLRSDVHHDNLHCDQKLERRHLEQAKARGAGVLDNGDLFCAMQGKWDPRSDRSQLRPEFQDTNDYLNCLVEYAADFLGPYADNLIELDHGNHETGIINHHNFNLTRALCKALNDKHGTDIGCGGIGGHVLFRLRRKRQQQTFILSRHHGRGQGRAEVTRGVIESNRMAVIHPDANIVWTGHSHDEWCVPVTRWRVSQKGVVSKDKQYHIRTPGYKDGTQDGYEGWENVKGMAPKPLGAAWLRFYRESHDFKFQLLTAD